MFHKFGSENRFSLTAAFSVSAVVAAMVAAAPSAQAQACVPSANGTPSATCQQYFSAGATFPLLLNRQFFDYFGIAIQPGPAINPGQPGATGSQPSNPAGSPRLPNGPSQQFNYCGTGSGNGRAVFTGVPATSFTSATCFYTDTTGILPFPTNIAGVSPSFAGSDTPLTATEETAYVNTQLNGPSAPTAPGRGRGNAIQVPTVFGAIDVINNPALGNLNLTTAQLCGIFDGSITSINGTPITVVIRSDSSGTTTAFTTYLASACPSVSGGSYYLTAGTNTFPAVSQTTTFNRQNGNDGVAGRVAAVANHVGYAEASFGFPFTLTALDPVTNTTNPAPNLANLENPSATVQTFVAPNPTTINRRLAGISLSIPFPAHPCVLQVAGLPVVPAAPALGAPLSANQAFPIVSTTYTLAYTRYSTTEQATAVRNVYNFILGSRTVPFPAANDQIAQGLGFSVLNNGTLNPPVVTNQLRASARACIAGITFPLLP
jgi:phosphate transport system substrate-binding protein